MKKIFSLIMLLLIGITLSSCGNRNYFDFEHDTYKHIHCLSTGKCYNITGWKNNEIGVKVSTTYGNLYFSEGTYILVEDKCPICNK